MSFAARFDDRRTRPDWVIGNKRTKILKMALTVSELVLLYPSQPKTLGLETGENDSQEDILLSLEQRIF